MPFDPQSASEVICDLCKSPCLRAGETFNGKPLCEYCIDYMTGNKDMKLIANSPETLSKAIGALRSEYEEHHYLRLTITSGKQRSVQMNALSHVWYQQVSDERGEMTPGEVKAFCKLHHGVPILRRDSEEFAEKYDAYIKPLDYPQKLNIVAMLEITSAMTTKQMLEYLEEVQRHYSMMTTDPVNLVYPEDI